MVKRKNPRHGSMQFWPRVRASRPYARVRSAPNKAAKLLGFAGYKVGMTHVVATDTGKTSPTKGEKISIPATIVECPALKVASVRFYTPSGYGVAVSKEIFMKTNKELLRKRKNAKTIGTAKDLDSVSLDSVKRIALQVYTQPKLTGTGKKTPEIFELPLGGSVQEQLDIAKQYCEKEITVSDMYSAGDIVDTRAVTTGRGNQGPVKRFGVTLRSHKSEKTRRGPGSLGGWTSQGHTMHRIAFSGQTGFHQRTQYNNQILAIIDDPKEVNVKGGFINFGEAKQPCIVIKGSIQGPKKRLITLTAPYRDTVKLSVPAIDSISLESKQGN